MLPPVTRFRLKRPVAQNNDVEPDDARNTQSALNRLGFLDLPDGPTSFPTGRMIDGLRRFQRAEGLKVDGVMKPGGETEGAVDRALKIRNQAQQRRRSAAGPERRDTPDSLIGFPKRSGVLAKGQSKPTEKPHSTPPDDGLRGPERPTKFQRPAAPDDPPGFPAAASRKQQGAVSRTPESPERDAAAPAPGLLSRAAPDDGLRKQEPRPKVPTRRVEPPPFSEAELDAVEVTRKSSESDGAWAARIERDFGKADLNGKRKILAAMARQWTLPQGIGEYRETASGKRVFTAPRTEEERRKFAFAQSVKPDAHKTAERAREEIQARARAGTLDDMDPAVRFTYFIGPDGIVYERTDALTEDTISGPISLPAYLRFLLRHEKLANPRIDVEIEVPEMDHGPDELDKILSDFGRGRLKSR